MVIVDMNGLDMLLDLTREFLDAKVTPFQAQPGTRMSWMSRNSLEPSRPSKSPLACRFCCAPCATN